MFDVTVLAKAVLVGAVVAATVMRLVAWLLRRGSVYMPQRDGIYMSRSDSARWSWAIGAGVLAASGATDQWPHWPALEDRARFLTLLVPLTILVETLAVVVSSTRMAWLMRIALAAIVAPILLHNTVYLAVLQGRTSAEWTPLEATMILCGLAAMLILIWVALSMLEARTSTLTVYGVLILDAFATAITVMLSGYFLGGLLGLGLAGAMTGAALSAYVNAPRSLTRGSLGIAVIGNFSIVLIGRFFGTLSTALAVCLLVAPLFAWMVELPRLNAFAPGWRAVQRLACVGIPLIVAVVIAGRQFVVASAAHSRPSKPNAVRDVAK
ncbi:MAG TPA: hypothetical protein VGN12_17995 [Pirellulales bacterium]|jgi:hypothetical protein